MKLQPLGGAPYYSHAGVISYLRETGKNEGAFHAVLHTSPTGDIIVNLSATRLTVIAATVSHGDYLLCIVSTQEPYLFPERHMNSEVSEKCPCTRARFMMVRHSLSPINGNTLSMRK